MWSFMQQEKWKNGVEELRRAVSGKEWLHWCATYKERGRLVSLPFSANYHRTLSVEMLRLHVFWMGMDVLASYGHSGRTVCQSLTTTYNFVRNTVIQHSLNEEMVTLAGDEGICNACVCKCLQDHHCKLI